MPELDEMIDRLCADTADVRWDDPATVRMRADRRDRRRRVAAVVAVVTVLLAGAGLVVALHRTGRPSGVIATRPTGPTPAAPTPSATPSTGSAAPSTPSAGPIPVSALLTAADVGHTTAGDVFDGPYKPNPFVNCGIDGYPHDSDLTAALAVSLHEPGQYGTLGDSVLAFRPGAAHAVLAGIEDLLAGGCRGHFTAVAHDLGGDESILLRGEDAEPGNAGGRRIAWYAIVRRGDRLAWVTVVDYATRADLAGYARTLASRAAQRMCAPSAC